MHVNRKIDRLKQWAGEKMGGDIKTNVSDDFKALETEMNVRYEGTDRIHKSMTAYIKSISKKNEGGDKEKNLPIAHLGGSMVTHGEDFDINSKYGQSLIKFGRTQERLARVQESYIAQVSSGLLESLERSLAQMKEYQASRKKLESRRLAYDTSLSKVQKAKREDFGVEEELRTQKAKYEEASDDVHRRMQDIKDADDEAVEDLAAFLEAQLAYHERCRDVLWQLKNEWPGAGPSPIETASARRIGRPRANTAHSFHKRYEPVREEPYFLTAMESRPVIRSGKSAPVELPELPARDSSQTDSSFQRPILHRVSTFEGPLRLRQDQSPGSSQSIHRAGSVNFGTRPDRSQLRPVSIAVGPDPYADPSETVDPFSNSIPDQSYGENTSSLATSYGSPMSSSTTLNSLGGGKKGPPPPPPSRAKKPPPPPPKRPSISAINT